MCITRKLQYRTALCAVLTGVIGCSGKSPEQGDYALRYVDGKAPPMILGQAAGCTIVALSSSMRILPADSFASSFQIMKHCPDSTVAAPDIGTRGPFSTAGDTLFFLNAQGLSGGSGVFHGDTIIVRGPSHELKYIHK